MTDNVVDPAVTDRLDIRWFVQIEAKCTGPYGTMTVKAALWMTLGTYAGEMTPAIMAENINQRGICEGDVTEVIGMDVPVMVGEAALATRGIMPEDISSMTIESVLVDDTPVASNFIQD
ncbi:MAG: hypothetical protein B7Y74_04030 [Novosphingobium sp. 35-62-5]|nr:MAG: hypothetical protein B7Y74_04030 [Novosphingobium sp. 35-62-5]